jgi:hypothetical protein
MGGKQSAQALPLGREVEADRREQERIGERQADGEGQ